MLKNPPSFLSDIAPTYKEVDVFFFMMFNHGGFADPVECGHEESPNW